MPIKIPPHLVVPTSVNGPEQAQTNPTQSTQQAEPQAPADGIESAATPAKQSLERADLPAKANEPQGGIDQAALAAVLAGGAKKATPTFSFHGVLDLSNHHVNNSGSSHANVANMTADQIQAALDAAGQMAKEHVNGHVGHANHVNHSGDMASPEAALTLPNDVAKAGQAHVNGHVGHANHSNHSGDMASPEAAVTTPAAGQTLSVGLDVNRITLADGSTVSLPDNVAGSFSINGVTIERG